LPVIGVNPESETVRNVTSFIEWGGACAGMEEEKARVCKAGCGKDGGSKRPWRISRRVGSSRTNAVPVERPTTGQGKKVREPVPQEKKLEDEIQKLKLSLAKRTLEVDFFKGALQKVAARRQRSSNTGEKASTTRSGE
jgi:hypothetical protein